MALNLTDNWQMALNLTDNWHLYPPIQTLYTEILVKIIVISVLICLKPLAQILKFTEKTFRCLSLSKATTLEPICGSGVSSKRFFTTVTLLILPCIDSWIQDFESCVHKD